MIDERRQTQRLTNPYGETTSFTYATCCTAVQDVIHANGARIHYDYDQAERITDVLNLKPDQTILKSFHYERDANGMVTNVEREDPIWNQAYLYDNRLQLQGAGYGEPSWMNELYFYDGRGNRMEKWVDGTVAETYGYNAADEIQSRSITDGVLEAYAYTYSDADDLLMSFKAISGFRNGWMGAKCRLGKGFMKDLSEPERGWNLFGDVYIADGEGNEVGKGFQRAKAAGSILDHSDEAIDAFTSSIG